MRECKLLYLITVLAFFYKSAQSQAVISGKVSDTLNNPIWDINVMVHPKHSGYLKAYSITDQNGRFTVEVNLETDSLDLLLSSIHYERT